MNASPTITLSQLHDNDACDEQIRLFERTFGQSVTLTLEICRKHAAEFDWSWASSSLLTSDRRNEYASKSNVFYAAYLAAIAPLQARVDAAETHAAAAAIVAPHKVAYQEKLATLFFEMYSAQCEEEVEKEKAALQRGLDEGKPVITLDQLYLAEACEDQTALFSRVFGVGVTLSMNLCLAYAQEFDWTWAGARLLQASYSNCMMDREQKANTVYQSVILPLQPQLAIASEDQHRALVGPALRVYKTTMAKSFFELYSAQCEYNSKKARLDAAAAAEKARMDAAAAEKARVDAAAAEKAEVAAINAEVAAGLGDTPAVPAVITLVQLYTKEACRKYTHKFETTFGERVELTPELCLANAREFDWIWPGERLLDWDFRTAFADRLESARCVYRKATEGIRDVVSAIDREARLEPYKRTFYRTLAAAFFALYTIQSAKAAEAEKAKADKIKRLRGVAASVAAALGDTPFVPPVISAEQLEAAGACTEETTMFRKTFGDRVALTPELCLKHAQKFNFGWAGVRLLHTRALQDFRNTRETARIKYHADTEPFRAPMEFAPSPERARVFGPHKKVYEEALALAFFQSYAIQVARQAAQDMRAAQERKAAAEREAEMLEAAAATVAKAKEAAAKAAAAKAAEEQARVREKQAVQALQADYDSGLPVITLAQLKSKNACDEECAMFHERFGNGVTLTEGICLNHADIFNWVWGGDRLLTGSWWRQFQRRLNLAREAYTFESAGTRSSFSTTQHTAEERKRRLQPHVTAFNSKMAVTFFELYSDQCAKAAGVRAEAVAKEAALVAREEVERVAKAQEAALAKSRADRNAMLAKAAEAMKALVEDGVAKAAELPDPAAAPVITLDQLADADACGEQQRLFQRTFGKAVTLTLPLCLKHADAFTFLWAGTTLLKGSWRREFVSREREACNAYQATLESLAAQLRPLGDKEQRDLVAPHVSVYNARVASAFFTLYSAQCAEDAGKRRIQEAYDAIAAATKAFDAIKDAEEAKAKARGISLS